MPVGSKHDHESTAASAGDVAGRRDLMVAGFAGAAGLGMIAAGWALARWPEAVLGSVDRIFQAIGGAPDSLGAAAGQSHGAIDGAGGPSGSGSAGGPEGGTRP